MKRTVPIVTALVCSLVFFVPNSTKPMLAANVAETRSGDLVAARSNTPQAKPYSKTLMFYRTPQKSDSPVKNLFTTRFIRLSDGYEFPPTPNEAGTDYKQGPWLSGAVRFQWYRDTYPPILWFKSCFQHPNGEDLALLVAPPVLDAVAGRQHKGYRGIEILGEFNERGIVTWDQRSTWNVCTGESVAFGVEGTKRLDSFTNSIGKLTVETVSIREVSISVRPSLIDR